MTAPHGRVRVQVDAFRNCPPRRRWVRPAFRWSKQKQLVFNNIQWTFQNERAKDPYSVIIALKWFNSSRGMCLGGLAGRYAFPARTGRGAGAGGADWAGMGARTGRDATTGPDPDPDVDGAGEDAGTPAGGEMLEGKSPAAARSTRAGSAAREAGEATSSRARPGTGTGVEAAATATGSARRAGVGSGGGGTRLPSGRAGAAAKAGAGGGAFRSTTGAGGSALRDTVSWQLYRT